VCSFYDFFAHATVRTEAPPDHAITRGLDTLSRFPVPPTWEPTGQVVCIAMEYVESEMLRAWLQQLFRTWHEVLGVGPSVARGLALQPRGFSAARGVCGTSRREWPRG
jgi:hypothetical protein